MFYLAYGSEAGFGYKLWNQPVEVIGNFLETAHIDGHESCENRVWRTKVQDMELTSRSKDAVDLLECMSLVLGDEVVNDKAGDHSIENGIRILREKASPSSH